MKKLGFALILALALTMVFASLAMAAPGQYTNPTDYRNSLPPASDPALADNVLGYGEGAKKEVIFAVTPMKAGRKAADTDYNGIDFRQGTNANQSGYDADLPGNTKSTTIRYAANNTMVHGSFKTNTNACASCHMTHTSAGDALLIRNGIFNTCTACHDGTLGRLDVFDMAAYTTTDPDQEVANFEYVGGGSFGGDVLLAGASMHIPTGYLEVAAAPGGNRTKSTTAYKTGEFGDNYPGPKNLTVNSSAWKADFTCSSCHQPHGSYSDRLLAPNPANIGRYDGALVVADFKPDDPLNPTTTTWKAFVGTQQITGPWTFGESYQPGYTQTVFYQETAPGVPAPNVTAEAMIPKAQQLNEMFSVNYAKGIAKLKPNWNTIEDGRFAAVSLATVIKVAIVPSTVVKIEKAVFNGKWVGGVETPGNYVYDRLAPGVNYLDYQGFDATVTKWTGEIKDVVPFVGNQFGDAADVAWTAENGTRSVTFNTAGDPTSGIKSYTTSARNGITWFCAGCHTDYYAEKFQSKTVDGVWPANSGATTVDGMEGTYSKAYRHTINRGALESEVDGRQNFIYEVGVSHGHAGEVLTCLGCHYAHGTSAEIMRNADDTQLAVGEKDVNPSSAIKRYVNMAVCYKCHSIQHADELMNSDYWYNGGDQSNILESNGYQRIP